MKMIKLLGAVLGFALLAGCSMSKDVALAQAQIPVFHSELDAGSFHEIYATSATDLQKVASEEDFSKLLEAVHRKLGNVKTSAQETLNIATTTSGTFVTVVNKSKFEQGDGDEQFVYRIDQGVAKLAGYHISSMALVLK